LFKEPERTFKFILYFREKIKRVDRRGEIWTTGRVGITTQTVDSLMRRLKGEGKEKRLFEAEEGRKILTASVPKLSVWKEQL